MRTKDTRADIEAIRALLETPLNRMTTQELIARTMRSCGVTYQQIGEVFNISKQAVEIMINKEAKQ